MDMQIHVGGDTQKTNSSIRIPENQTSGGSRKSTEDKASIKKLGNDLSRNDEKCMSAGTDTTNLQQKYSLTSKNSMPTLVGETKPSEVSKEISDNVKNSKQRLSLSSDKFSTLGQVLAPMNFNQTSKESGSDVRDLHYRVFIVTFYKPKKYNSINKQKCKH